MVVRRHEAERLAPPPVPAARAGDADAEIRPVDVVPEERDLSGRSRVNVIPTGIDRATRSPSHSTSVRVVGRPRIVSARRFQKPRRSRDTYVTGTVPLRFAWREPSPLHSPGASLPDLRALLPLLLLFETQARVGTHGDRAQLTLQLLPRRIAFRGQRAV